ncbi:MAG: rod shape-determining protein MreC [bacterium]|nr:rod shape-determining protein MreC [bacterium]
MTKGYRTGGTRRSRSGAPRRLLTVFLAIAVLIALVKTFTLITGNTNPVDRAINTAATPLVIVVRFTVDGFSSLGHIFRLPSLLRENSKLHGENSELRKLLAENDLLRSTNAQLRSSLKLVQPQFNLVNAAVIARPYDLWLDQVILDVGSRKGVRAGNLVVNPSGVVGIVDDRVEDSTCWVTLVTSPRFRLAAVTGTNEVEGVIRGLDNRSMALEGVRGRPAGADDGNLELMHVKAGSDVKVGEKVFSAGVTTVDEVASRRPRGQLIGTVIHKSVDANSALEVRVEPAVNVNRINIVAVITQ